MRSIFFLLLAGCATAPLPPEPIKPASSGGTLFVIDAPVDFISDVGEEFFDNRVRPEEGRFLGEQAFRIVLRSVNRVVEARLVGSDRAPLESGRPVVLRVFRPLEYLLPLGRGRYELRRSAMRAPTLMEVTPILSNDEKYVTLRYVLKHGVAWRKPLDDTGVEAGEPTGTYERTVEEHTRTIPVGAALLFSIPRDSDRAWLVILHVASVAPKP